MKNSELLATGYSLLAICTRAKNEEGFLHHMWTLCNEAQAHVKDRVWLESNVGGQAMSKASTRELTYRALIEYLETQPD